MDKQSSVVAYITAAFTGMTVNEFVGVLGVVGTFFINWYYKAKDDRRKSRLPVSRTNED